MANNGEQIDRYAGRQARGSEYGGKDGLIQRASDGHVELTPQEKATIMRMHGLQGDLVGDGSDYIVSAGVDVDEQQTAWEDAAHRNKALRRQNVDQRLNGRGIGDGLV